MAELITRVTPLGVEQHVRYSKDEIRALWAKNPPHEHRKSFLRVPNVLEHQALELSAIWLRQYNVDPASFSYIHQTQEMYFYFRDLGERAAWQNQLRAYELVGVDERGPLFADPDAREINPLPLLQLAQEVLSWEALQPVLKKRVEEAIAKAYAKDGVGK